MVSPESDPEESNIEIVTGASELGTPGTTDALVSMWKTVVADWFVYRPVGNDKNEGDMFGKVTSELNTSDRETSDDVILAVTSERALKPDGVVAAADTGGCISV